MWLIYMWIQITLISTAYKDESETGLDLAGVLTIFVGGQKA